MGFAVTVWNMQRRASGWDYLAAKRSRVPPLGMPRMRRLAGELVCAAVRWSGLATLVRHTVARRRVGILLYHDPAPSVLARHLAYLASCGYALVSLDDLVSALRAGRLDGLPSKAIVVTFDDGHSGNFELFDVFRRCRVRPTIYICSQIVASRRQYWFMAAPERDVERLKRLPSRRREAELASVGFNKLDECHPDVRQALSAEQIRQMAPWVSFESHSRFHPILTMCLSLECKQEIANSKSEVEALTGSQCRHFSYPNGDYGEREREMVASAGYQSARTIEMGWNGPRTDPFRLRILGTPDDASVDRLAADLTGLGLARAVAQGRFGGRRCSLLPPRSV